MSESFPKRLETNVNMLTIFHLPFFRLFFPDLQESITFVSTSFVKIWPFVVVVVVAVAVAVAVAVVVVVVVVGGGGGGGGVPGPIVSSSSKIVKLKICFTIFVRSVCAIPWPWCPKVTGYIALDIMIQRIHGTIVYLPTWMVDFYGKISIGKYTIVSWIPWVLILYTLYIHTQKLRWPLKNNGWKTTFLLKWSLFRGTFVNFEGVQVPSDLALKRIVSWHLEWNGSGLSRNGPSELVSIQ